MANPLELGQFGNYISVDVPTQVVSVGSSIRLNPSSGNVEIERDLQVSGVSTFVDVISNQLSVSGVSTFATANITNLNVSDLNVNGISTFVGVTTFINLVSLASTIKVDGFVETQSPVSIGGSILTLDASQGTVFTHTTTANIGIVSFTGIRTDGPGAQTFTVLINQGAIPYNITAATGIGTQLASITINPGNVGYSTHIKVGAGSSIILTNRVGAFDILTFVVSYNGATSIANTSFTVVGFAATDFRNSII